MSYVKRTVAVTAVTCILAIADLGPTQAGDFATSSTQMKPLYAVSFDFERKHVLSYFLDKGNQCGLTIVVTDRPDEVSEGDEMPVLTAVHSHFTIDGGETAHVDIAEGKSLEYACATDAQAMSVRQASQVAAASPSQSR